MEQADKQEFAKVLEATMVTYGREYSSMVLSIWWEALKRFDLPAVRAAFSRHIQDVDVGQYPPKPADILRILQGGTTQDRAFVAWSMVDKAIRHVGGFETVVFDDHLIHYVIDQMGGWGKLCDTPEDEMPYRAQEFQKRYRGAWHNPPQSFPAKLVGRLEHHNRQKGFLDWLEPPTLIGDEAACQQVISQGAEARPLQIRKAKEITQTLEYDGDR